MALVKVNQIKGDNPEGTLNANGTVKQVVLRYELEDGTPVKGVMFDGSAYYDRAQMNDDEILAMKHHNFKRIMERKVTNLFDGFRQVENLFNRGSYEWTEDEADAVLGAIVAKYNIIKTKAAVQRGQGNAKVKEKFSF